ncbi:hypothetical protein L596_026006 [Steinernema carpocapsae]|uniref:ABC-2 type transporter transmembrane domain-containing protein n=1 Tax=Steinernema carpocapsae TaxID=34508 RepID=A0A4U5M070_STECR|nr:hypothetical protein L596_026006 [Steinernema carpocapsae]
MASCFLFLAENTWRMMLCLLNRQRRSCSALGVESWHHVCLEAFVIFEGRDFVKYHVFDFRIINGARVFADLMFRMGEHPKLYKDAFEELGKIIHKLAEGNSTSGNIIFRLASLRLLELYDKLDQEDWSSVTGLFKRLLTINDTNWMDMVTCGDNFDDLTAGSSDSEDDDGGEDDDELSEMKKKVINYVAKIAPAGDRDPSKSCEGIAVKANHTCTHMKAILVKQLELLIGRILVSPNIRIVRDLVDKLNEPLKMANLLVDSVKDFTQVSKRLQDSLANSDLAKAAKALLTLLETKPEAIPFPLRKLIRQMKPFLQHWFNPSSDSEAFFVTMDKVANVFLSYADCMDFDRFVIVENEPLLETQALCLTERNQYLSGLVFLNVTEKSEEFPPQIWYKIRHLSTLVDGTDAIIASRRVLLSRDQPLVDLKYLSFGFSFLQDAVFNAQQEPYPCVNVDTFNVSMFLGLFVLLSWMIPSALLVKNIVHEKEMRLKEMMRIMGLGDAIHWLAWAFQAFMFNIFSIAFIALLLKFGKILPDTDLTILFVILILFALSCICQCILISTFFTRTNIAAVFTAMFFFLAFFPFQLSVKSVFTHITLLFPQTAVGYGFLMLSQADTLGEATWATMDLIYLQEYNVRFGTVLASFGITSFLYYLMAWYISAVFPGTYGVGQRWYFFVTKRYWWPKMKDSTLTEDLVEERIHDSVSLKGSSEFKIIRNDIKSFFRGVDVRRRAREPKIGSFDRWSQ